MFTGCEVHAFDELKRIKKSAKEEGVTVHSYGLSHKAGKIKVPQKGKKPKSVKVKTLQEALAENGHKNSDITYLKVRPNCLSVSLLQP